jgi:hypothetical protein
VAEQKLRDNIRDQERVSVGLLAPAAQRETFENPMEKLVDGYVADLKALGRSADHVRHVDKRLRRLMRECHWQALRDATADAFLCWRAETNAGSQNHQRVSRRLVGLVHLAAQTKPRCGQSV